MAKFVQFVRFEEKMSPPIYKPLCQGWSAAGLTDFRVLLQKINPNFK